MKKTVMILGASILQLPAIIKAKEMGLNVVVVDMNPNAIGFRESGIIKEIISTIDIPNVLIAAKKHEIDGILTICSDMPMRTVAAVAKELNLIGISEETALKATNKYEMRKALQNNAVPIPKFYRISTFDELKDKIKFFSETIILKPADNSGSRGIVRIDDLNNIDNLFNSYQYCVSNSRNGDILVEEYMYGDEISVETMSFKGECKVIQITDKLTTGAPHYVEMGHSQPSKFVNSDLYKDICKIAIEANKAVGITNGPSHTEIMVTNNGPKIVEIGARLGGDFITTDLVPLSTGIDMVENVLKISLGLTPNLNVKYNKGSAIRYFSQKKGILKNIYNIDIAKSIDGIKKINFIYNYGDEIQEITDSSKRIGFVIAQNDDAEQAINSCKKAVDTIKIVIE